MGIQTEAVIAATLFTEKKQLEHSFTRARLTNEPWTINIPGQY